MTDALTLPASAGVFEPGEKVRVIRLYGVLGARFGRVHRFVCSNTAEAVSALCRMIPGFERFLYESKDKGLGYACFIGRENIDESGLQYPAGDEDIRIAPMILGSGRGGLFQIILGAALIVAAPYIAGALWGASATAAVAVAQYMPMVGWALALGGVAQLFSKQPQGLVSRDSPDNGASYSFNGPVNAVAQGNPAPVHYGELFVGSATISGDMFAEDQQ